MILGVNSSVISDNKCAIIKSVCTENTCRAKKKKVSPNVLYEKKKNSRMLKSRGSLRFVLVHDG